MCINFILIEIFLFVIRTHNAAVSVSQSYYTQSKVVIIPSELWWIDLYEQKLKNITFRLSVIGPLRY